MSPLHRRNPSEAVQEILRERRAAIESGKLKGRRLFEACEGSEEERGFDGREEICIGFFDLVRASGARSVSGSSNVSLDDANDSFGSKEDMLPSARHRCSNSGSSLFNDNTAREVVELSVEEKKCDVPRGDRGKRMFFMGGFAIALMALAIGIISLRCNEGCGVEEVILVPT